MQLWMNDLDYWEDTNESKTKIRWKVKRNGKFWDITILCEHRKHKHTHLKHDYDIDMATSIQILKNKLIKYNHKCRCVCPTQTHI